MKYRVSVGWSKFLFDSGDEAVKFALSAKLKSKNDIHVYIELLNEKDLEEEGEENV